MGNRKELRRHVATHRIFCLRVGCASVMIEKAGLVLVLHFRSITRLYSIGVLVMYRNRLAVNILSAIIMAAVAAAAVMAFHGYTLASYALLVMSLLGAFFVVYLNLRYFAWGPFKSLWEMRRRLWHERGPRAEGLAELPTSTRVCVRVLRLAILSGAIVVLLLEGVVFILILTGPHIWFMRLNTAIILLALLSTAALGVMRWLTRRRRA